jgi:hypothetical protein
MGSSWLVLLTAALLLLAIGALAFHAPARHGYGPFGLGVIASALVLLGRFVFVSDIATYTGVGLLVAASLWNARPHRAEQGGMHACAPSV